MIAQLKNATNQLIIINAVIIVKEIKLELIRRRMGFKISIIILVESMLSVEITLLEFLFKCFS